MAPLAQCFRVYFIIFACILLCRDLRDYICHELRDYSLGQIAFAVCRALFAITQLLCHVSAYYVSACNICVPAERLL